MRSFTERGKTRCKVGRECELGRGPGELAMSRYPSGDTEWAVGYLSLEFRSWVTARDAELGVVSSEVVIEAACSFRARGSIVCCGKQVPTSHLARRLARCLWAPTASQSQCVGGVCLTP